MTNAETSVAASVAATRPLRALYAGNARSVMQRGWRATVARCCTASCSV